MAGREKKKNGKKILTFPFHSLPERPFNWKFIQSNLIFYLLCWYQNEKNNIIIQNKKKKFVLAVGKAKSFIKVPEQFLCCEFVILTVFSFHALLIFFYYFFFLFKFLPPQMVFCNKTKFTSNAQITFGYPLGRRQRKKISHNMSDGKKHISAFHFYLIKKFFLCRIKRKRIVLFQ